MSGTDYQSVINKILEAIPSQLSGLGKEAKEQCKQSIKNILRDMDLVTREEFEVQRKCYLKPER